MNERNALVVFQDKKIRRKWHNNEWYFSVVDVVGALTDSPTPRQYWGKVKNREFLDLQLSPIWVQLKLKASDGKNYATDCANTKGIFRIIQSIPSKRAEPFKQWLAEVGYQRVQEIENPELAQDRVKEYYELKGYPKDWVDKRLRGIAVRQDLTDEWKERGLEHKREFAILTNEIHKATFDVSIQKHKNFKSLPKQSKANLRDHMTDLELIFSMLGERATTEITQTKDAKGFNELKTASKKGGNIAKNARIELEEETGKKVLSKNNFLIKSKKTKSIQDKRKKK
jgi:DNA-damage-inducible protein D